MTEKLAELPEGQVPKEVADKAFANYTQIKQRKLETGNTMLELGRLFKECRDNEYFTFIDCENFTDYLGMPEISMGYSTVYSLIHVYEKYVEEHKFPKALLTEVGHKKLQIINPVIDDNPDEWIYKAKELSRSDLTNEVRIAQGKAEIKFEKEKASVEPFTQEDYESFVSANPCCVCGEKEVVKAHFPRTKKRGAPDTNVIPLCTPCHNEFHKDPYDFLWNYKEKIFNYFYNTILKAYKVLDEFRKS